MASVYVCALFATSKNYGTTTISTVVVSTCFISRTAPSKSTTYGKFVLHLYVEYNKSVGCLSTRTAVFYSTLFVLYPNVRHARSRCSRLVSWVTTITAVTFVVFETTF